MNMPETFHVGLSTYRTEPFPVTFYLSPEILADAAITDRVLADILLADLTAAIKYHRERFLATAEEPQPLGLRPFGPTR